MDLSTGSTLVLGGAWAWGIAASLVWWGPLPSGRRLRQALGALLGATALSTLLLVAGLTALLVGV